MTELTTINNLLVAEIKAAVETAGTTTGLTFPTAGLINVGADQPAGSGVYVADTGPVAQVGTVRR